LDRLLESALFFVGLLFGSFLNVCISRLPYDESVVSPRSHCPHCNHLIAWYDNIPLLSWILLRARCRTCGEPISLRYPAVELVTGICFAACIATFGLSWITLKYCVFVFLLIGLIFMDGETGLLPREFTYSGIALGLAFSWIVPTDYAATELLFRIFGHPLPALRTLSFLDSFLGAAVGAGFFYMAWALYYLVRKQHGLGFGDVALMGMSGAFLGLKLVIPVIVISPLAGVLYVGVQLVKDSFSRARTHEAEEPDFLKREIRFGVFLGGSSLLMVFFGEALLRLYFQQF
jgi:leader peptidase (prepilin peptidase) / N-methyltransferase